MAHKNEKNNWKKNHPAYIVFVINTCRVIGNLARTESSTSEHVKINFQLFHLIIPCCLCFTFQVVLLHGLGLCQ